MKGESVRKQMLRMCGGRCKEKSAKVVIYRPTRKEKIIIFKRAEFCMNKGCGWRQALPDVQIDAVEVLQGKSEIIKSYLRKAQKGFRGPNLPVKMLWRVWVHGWSNNGPLDFEAYLKGLEGD